MRRFTTTTLASAATAISLSSKVLEDGQRASYTISRKKGEGGKGNTIAQAPSQPAPAAAVGHNSAATTRESTQTSATTGASTTPLPFSMSYYASHSLSPEAEGHPCRGSNYANVSENTDVSSSNPTKGRQEVRVRGSRGLFENASNVEGGAWWNVRPAEATAASRASSIDPSYNYGSSMPRAGVTRYSRLFSVPTHADSGKNGVWAFPRDIR